MRFYHRGRLVQSACRYTGRKRAPTRATCRAVAQCRPLSVASRKADRASLLITTALASTLIAGGMLAPTPASAVVACVQPASPLPILDSSATDAITCVNTVTRTNAAGDAINLSTAGAGLYIDLYNSGLLTASQDGIDTLTTGDDSSIAIQNLGHINAGNNGILANTQGNAAGGGDDSGIAIDNEGDIDAGTNGIYGRTLGGAGGGGSNVGIAIDNAGDIDAGTNGIYGRTESNAGGGGSNAGIAIDNEGDIDAGSNGILAQTYGNAGGASSNAGIAIDNWGNIAARTGIVARTFGSAIGTDSNVGIAIANGGDIATTSSAGLYARTDGSATNTYSNAGIAIDNEGDIDAGGTGIDARTYGDASGAYSNAGIAIANEGDIEAGRYGILAVTSGSAGGVYSSAGIAIANEGDIDANSTGIFARTVGNAANLFSDAGIVIDNAGDINAGRYGIYAYTGGSPTGANSKAGVSIVNSGNVFAGDTGVLMASNHYTMLVNRGSIAAGSLFAIDADGAATTILNASGGAITGFVDLTDNADYFTNEAGATFEARLTSDFRMGDDLFTNGGRVQTAGNAGAAEFTSFVGLETFDNSGKISLVDGREGDLFQISNTVGGTDLDFNASKGSKLAVDAFLGPPGSTADVFVIDGDVTGRTRLTVNNTNPGPGAFNSDGILVVNVPNGNVASNAFFLQQPIDAGLFDYDLFFVPTGSGFFELRSFPGGGAHILPQLLTASQDVWYATAETWLDRTADLRVHLSGAPAPANLKDGSPMPAYGTVTPGLWVRGSGTWLDRDDSASTSAYGRTYKYNLDRDLDLGTVQGGVDFGKRGMFAEGDALLFGVLGGAVFGELTYDQLGRTFDIDGGEVGGYVTYLSGGLYVDNLLKVNFTEFDASANSGIPGLDSTVWGIRSDAGYRFGAPRQGMFVEPQATIAAAWTDMDNFTFGANKVTFGDETDVRGRLGLRVGTSHVGKDGTLVEPFVTGSVWGDFSGDNKATVTSLGTTFGPFKDEGDDVWGVLSGGLNVFSPSGKSSAFVKADWSFGDELDGLSAKLGLRHNW